MRINSIEIEAFRAFGEQQEFDLDGDVILFVGRNGFGKSTVFDALSWCCFGQSPRFGGSRDYTRAGADYLANAFMSEGTPRVRVSLEGSGQELFGERRGNSFSFVSDGVAKEAEEGEIAILRELGFEGPDALETVNAWQKRALDTFSRTFLLHQDRLSAFVTSETPRDRFDTFARLFLATPVRHFYSHLLEERGTTRKRRDQASRDFELTNAGLAQIRRELNAERERIEEIAQTRQPHDAVGLFQGMLD